MMRTWSIVAVSAMVMCASSVSADAGEFASGPTHSFVYLFSSFRGNGEDGLHLAYSHDGLKWNALNGDKPFLRPQVGGKLMRDPCIIQGPDGVFHMVWTTSWRDRGIGIAHSKDLITWTEQQFISVMADEPAARNCWAPEITWDPVGKQYVIYWATTITDRFLETAPTGDDGWNHRMYCTTTRNFKTYTPTKLFYDSGFNVIDATIVCRGDSHVMILKDETRHPPAKNLRLATSSKVSGPWSAASEPFTRKDLWVEGPSCLKVGKWWVVYYDEYRRHKYGGKRTTDFKTWEDISDELVFPNGTRHGTALRVSTDVLEGLMRGDVTSAQQHQLVYVGADVLPGVEINGESAIIHTQGLYVTDRHYLVTGRSESEPKRALLLRFVRNDVRTYEFIDITPPAVNGETLDHPGGFDVDSKGRLWIPLATSHANGTSLICRFGIEPDRPLTPRKPEIAFRVNDHIGAICRTKDDSLVGANWDTKRVYVWSAEGALLTNIDRNNVFPDAPDWQLAVQDWKFVDRKRSQLVIAGGIDKSRDSSQATIQLIDLRNGKIHETHRFPKRDNVSRPITNEGLALHESTVYLLPEDIGRGAKVLRFQLTPTLDSEK